MKGKSKFEHRTEGKANGKVHVVKLAPDSPGARDEGPRLLPLDGDRPNTYGSSTDLADVALGRKPGRSVSQPPSKPARQRKQPNA